MSLLQEGLVSDMSCSLADEPYMIQTLRQMRVQNKLDGTPACVQELCAYTNTHDHEVWRNILLSNKNKDIFGKPYNCTVKYKHNLTYERMRYCLKR